jgi:Zn-dependent M32 family carboxypeptidase
MMKKESVIEENNKAVRLISIIRDHLHDQKFKEKHRTSSKVFVRSRKINFVTVILLVLRKSVKSAQLVLNEFFKDFCHGIQATNSAFTQARKHLQYQAFITLNQKIVDVLYSDYKYHHFKGFRVLSIDGSKIHLPNTPEIDQEFGTIQFINGKTLEVMGQRGYGLGESHV